MASSRSHARSCEKGLREPPSRAPPDFGKATRAAVLGPLVQPYVTNLRRPADFAMFCQVYAPRPKRPAAQPLSREKNVLATRLHLALALSPTLSTLTWRAFLFLPSPPHLPRRGKTPSLSRTTRAQYACMEKMRPQLQLHSCTRASCSPPSPRSSRTPTRRRSAARRSSCSRQYAPPASATARRPLAPRTASAPSIIACPFRRACALPQKQLSGQ